MKSIVILYESNSKFGDEKVFDGKSGKELCKAKADQLELEIVKISQQKSLSDLLKVMNETCKENQADYAIYSYDDLPFLDLSLSEKVIKAHEEYKAEYTFADGYPYGFAPEAISTDTLGILEEMALSTHKDEGEKPVSRDSLWNLIKTEVNNFEVEAVLSDEDWRLLRLAFHCGKKDNFLSSKALFEIIKDKENLTPDQIAEIGSKNYKVLKTVPGFYNIQVSDFVSNNSIYTPYNSEYEKKNNISPMNCHNVMSYDNFSVLIDKISDFSDTAVISLSGWGEPFDNKDILKMIKKVLSYEGLSVFIETDGTKITEDIAQKLAEIKNNAAPRTNGWDSLMIAITLDAMDNEMYKTVHLDCNNDDFNLAIRAVSLLGSYLPGSVYPEFTRMNENESELESFFRYWNDKSNSSGGKFIINKYEDFAGLLPKRKPADLSPLVREPCWHLRRDMTILSNGDVPLCHGCVFSNIQGNVFKTSLDDIWKMSNNTLIEHINKKYNNNCGKCDEYYTFNF